LSFFEILQSAPRKIVSRETLPEWLNDKLDLFTNKPLIGVKTHVFKGIWQGEDVYLITNGLQSNINGDAYLENGEEIVRKANDDFEKNSDNWILIWEHVIWEAVTRSEFVDDSAVAEDEYQFPQLSTEWRPDETVQSRLDALQIPDGVLNTISTAGLLETCLNFPYIIDIFWGNDYQQGFEALLAEFNGFRELLKRPDLINTLLGKYSRMSKEVAEKQMRSDMEKGMFSFRHLVLEFILAQDMVLENLNEEQDRYLFMLSFEHTKIEKNYPDIFSDLNTLPTYLLYAKKIMDIPDANADMKVRLMDFIQAPVSIEPETMRSLEDYFTAKYNK
jgi:hypothetical protein